MRIVLFLLKCVVGLFASLGFLMVAVTLLIGVLVSKGERLQVRKVEVPETIVLYLDATAGIIESRPDNPLARASMGPVLELHKVIRMLAEAEKDPQVAGLVVHSGWGVLGMAQLQELRQAIVDFKASGKPVTAFSESFGAGGNGTLHYYLASVAEEVWLQPSGDLDLTGFALESPFLREALDRIGIEPQIGQREEYKGAMSFITDQALPAPQRENLQRLLDSWLGQVAEGVAASREMESAQVRRLVDQGPYDSAAALEAGLVDRVGYWDEVNLAVLEAAGENADFMDFRDYAAVLERDKSKEDTEGTIALIRGLGEVVLGGQNEDPFFGEVAMASHPVAQAIRDAVDDPLVDAIVFRVDSPGGSYVAADVIWREVQRARDAGKPVIVSMGNLAASGGYFVAAPAHKIVALPGTVTGSIGVIAGKLDLGGLWDNLSINWDGVQAGENAGIWSGNKPFTAAQRAYIEKTLDRTYADFTGKVAAGRGLSDEATRKAAKGQVWTGEDALELGLVDALGGMETAIVLAKEAAGLDPEMPAELKPFPEPVSPFDYFVQDFIGSEARSPLLRDLSAVMTRVFRALAPLLQALEGVSGETRVERLRAPDLKLN